METNIWLNYLISKIDKFIIEEDFWKALSENPCLTDEDINKYPDKPLKKLDIVQEIDDRHYYSSNDQEIIEDIMEYRMLCNHPKLTLKIIDTFEPFPHINFWWGKNGISSNPNITIEFIEKYIDKKWDWESVVKTLRK